MLIEALSTYIKALGEKTYSILSNSNNDGLEIGGEIDGLIEEDLPIELQRELMDYDEVKCVSDIDLDEKNKYNQ